MRKINIIGIALFIIAFSAYAYITWPHHVLKMIDGIEYSQTDKDYSSPVTILIHGTMKKEMTGGRSFTGTIELKEADISFPRQKMVLLFDEADWSSLSFRDLDGKLYDYGELFAAEKMDKVVICTPENNESGNTAGNILAFPADDREEAVALATKFFDRERELKIK